jgi:hypothetical protein
MNCACSNDPKKALLPIIVRKVQEKYSVEDEWEIWHRGRNKRDFSNVFGKLILKFCLSY